MLYQIDHKTWLDLPQWKCREEFGQLFLLQRQPHPDPDELERLKAECDRIEQTHIRRSAASLRTARRMWADPERKSQKSKAVDMFGRDGRFIRTFDSAAKAAKELRPDNHVATAMNICRCRRGEAKTACGYIFRDHVDDPKDIEPYTPGNLRMRVLVTYGNGNTRAFDSLSECAHVTGVSKQTVWLAVHSGKTMRCGASVSRIE